MSPAKILRYQKRQTRWRGVGFAPTRKPYKVSKKKFLDALKNSAGQKPVIAKSLRVSLATVYRLLARSDWTDVKEAYEEEVSVAADIAFSGLLYVVNQNRDLNAKIQACVTILKAKRPLEYGEKSRVIVGGGNNPIQAHTVTPHIDVSSLEGLSAATKRELLAATH